MRANPIANTSSMTHNAGMSNCGQLPSDPAALGDEIARTAAHLDAATHRLLACIRAFDVSEEWERQGALSCAHWLSWRIGLDPGTAREKVRVARALGGLPRLDEALRRGALSYAKVRALTRVATPQNEERLLEAASACTGAQLERLCRQLRRAAGTANEAEQLGEQRMVREEVLGNGMVRLTIVLHPDEAAVVTRAIDEARRPAANGADPADARAGDLSAETPPGAMITRADAVVKIAESYLAHPAGAGPGAPRAQIFVHLDQDPLAADGHMAATLDDGTRVPAEAFRRLACDGVLVAVRQAGGASPLDVGRRTRTVSGALRRALWVRDRGCRFPGCTNRHFVHAHHIHHWAHGGATKATNLLLLCSAHHRLVHEGGFGIRRGSDGQLAFARPDGKAIASAPSPHPLEGEPWQVLTSWSEDQALEIDAQTGFPGWGGEHLDYTWAADALLTA